MPVCLFRCIAVAAILVSTAASWAQDRPNIVFILADDLGYGDLSCFGQKKFQTPHLDELAQSGMRLTQHYSGCPVCAPSRCVLLTGLHTGHSAIRSNRAMIPKGEKREPRTEGQHPLPDAEVTIAELLHQAGYHTGAFGKWGLGFPGSEGDPIHQGFDEFYGYNCQSQAHRYYPDHLWHNLEKVPLDGTAYSDDLIVDEALDFIRDNRDKPFFCYMPLTLPHAALEVPEEYKSKFREQFAEHEDVIGRYAQVTFNNPPAAFAGMVTKLDSDVGRVTALLKELGIADNTIVIFSADNGPHHEGGHEPAFFNSTGPYRGIKRDLYEGGIRMSTIAAWPGKIPAGTTSDHASAFWDWLPTFCELAGIKSDLPKTDGISLMSTLLGQDDQQPHESLYWEFHEQGGKQGVRVGDWKAIRLNVRKNPDGPLELYNVADDPSETRNIAEQHPDLVAKFSQLMAESRTDAKFYPFGKNLPRDKKKQKNKQAAAARG